MAMNTIAAILTVLGLANVDEAEALRATAPDYLDAGTARMHLSAAGFAAEATGLPEEVLLAIGYHESRYASDARSREPGARWSCGPMTPEPHTEPCAWYELTALGGYLLGARHLRAWVDACGGDLTCGLRSYVGGYAFARACLEGPHFVRPGVDACDVQTMFLDRAAWIRARINKTGGST